MAKKVTVSIPDMLHEKMEQWRESFNLSKMFQDAVTEAIQKKEDLQKRIREDLNQHQIIERLRKEKQESEGNYFETGKNEGVQWARTAHYDDLMYALNWKGHQNAEKDRVLGSYFTERLAGSRMMSVTEEGNNEYFSAYLDGWKNGVEHFWQEIRDKI